MGGEEFTVRFDNIGSSRMAKILAARSTATAG